eukprot:351236-Chlamydomonas_euryale.AAC.1
MGLPAAASAPPLEHQVVVARTACGNLSITQLDVTGPVRKERSLMHEMLPRHAVEQLLEAYGEDGGRDARLAPRWLKAGKQQAGGLKASMPPAAFDDEDAGGAEAAARTVDASGGSETRRARERVPSSLLGSYGTPPHSVQQASGRPSGEKLCRSSGVTRKSTGMTCANSGLARKLSDGVSGPAARERRAPHRARSSSLLAGGGSGGGSLPGGGDCGAGVRAPLTHAEAAKISKHHECVTVLFADIANFTKRCSEMATSDVVLMLHQLFSLWDAMLDAYDVFKVETIGECGCSGGGKCGGRFSPWDAMLDAYDVFKVET